MIRVVLIHKEHGIYLGSCMGMGFFTLLDCAGQPAAVTFNSFKDAKVHVETWQPPIPIDDFRFETVETADRWITPRELRAAGLGDLLGDMEAEALRYAEPAGRA